LHWQGTSLILALGFIAFTGIFRDLVIVLMEADSYPKVGEATEMSESSVDRRLRSQRAFIRTIRHLRIDESAPVSKASRFIVIYDSASGKSITGSQPSHE